MNREDLGKMLKSNLHWPVLSGGSDEYQKMVDDDLQEAAEGFWNDVIDALMEDVKEDPSDSWEWQFSTERWLEDQKIKED